ncbi:MAG: response regulator, partial [Nitrospinae bacterium]|nr:response regulator [Nitrospinota bacterium]
MTKRTKQTILIVEDSPVNASMVEKILSPKYKTIIAETGEKALEVAFSRKEIDLILLDIMLPGIDGYEVCKLLKENDTTRDIPIIFLTAKTETDEETKGLEMGGVDYIYKPVKATILLARVETQLTIAYHNLTLEGFVEVRTKELLETQKELQKALKNLKTTKIINGVYWVQIPEAGVNILCGCPADIVKHLMLQGYITEEKKGNIVTETGPNVILLSDVLIQNGKFSNIAEFPVLQMLYRQGMILPNHPNNTGEKPILVGSKEQVEAQMDYIYRGNYGLVSKKELMDVGCTEEEANMMMFLKLKFAFGKIQDSKDFIDPVVVEKNRVEIKNGVYIERSGFNKYTIEFKDNTTEVDLNLNPDEAYEPPYTLGFQQIRREYFAVIHSGEGDGWDVKRQSMSSILIYQGDIYLIDACPNIYYTLRSFGIDVSEIKGIFHTHAHDDHFAGLPALMMSGRKIKYFATPLIRASVAKKLSALMSINESKFEEYFEVHDLTFNSWYDYDGLEIMPMYSPHPLETNIFMFRVLDDKGYKTYAHLADIVSLDTLQTMLKDAHLAGLDSKEVYEDFKASYLIPVDLKKIDIGGGLIHGRAIDFKEDQSEKIILAHTARQLTNEEKEIGSQAVFGAVDVLSLNALDYNRRLSFQYLSEFFPTLPFTKIRGLLNSNLEYFNSGTIIQKKGHRSDYILLILTGSVEYIHPDSKIHN